MSALFILCHLETYLQFLFGFCPIILAVFLNHHIPVTLLSLPHISNHMLLAMLAKLFPNFFLPGPSISALSSR